MDVSSHDLPFCSCCDTGVRFRYWSCQVSKSTSDCLWDHRQCDQGNLQVHRPCYFSFILWPLHARIRSSASLMNVKLDRKCHSSSFRGVMFWEYIVLLCFNFCWVVKLYLCYSFSASNSESSRKHKLLAETCIGKSNIVWLTSWGSFQCFVIAARWQLYRAGSNWHDDLSC